MMLLRGQENRSGLLWLLLLTTQLFTVMKLFWAVSAHGTALHQRQSLRCCRHLP